MVEFRTVKNPASLKAIPFEIEDALVLGRHQQTNVSVTRTGTGLPTQLNIRHESNMTYVQPVGETNKVLPWKFTGYVSPRDCAAWYYASLDAPGITKSDAAVAIEGVAAKVSLPAADGQTAE